MVNNFKFFMKDRERYLKTQNSGVVVRWEMSNVDYYGVLSDVVELQYMGENRVVLFKCDCWNVHSQGRGIDVDKYDIVSVNIKRQLMLYIDADDTILANINAPTLAVNISPVTFEQYNSILTHILQYHYIK